MSIDRVLAAAASSPWAMMPEKLAAIQAFLQARADGVRFSSLEIEARVGSGRTGAPAPSGPITIAIIPIVGIISQRVSVMDDISGPGGTSTDRVGAAFRRAIADTSIKAVVLDVDSPGGSTYGVQELADEIHRARGRKPIVAQVNSLAASAAYWIASAASEVVCTPGGDVGSIGVYGLHTDVSAMLDKAGIRKTFISAGEFKTEGNPFGPLTDEARDFAQKRVNEAYGDFVQSVARGRGTSAARVRAEFGKGRTVGAREALKAGMVDRIGTLQETLRRLGSSATAASAGAGSAASASASADDDFRRRRHAHRSRLLPTALK